MAFVLSLIVPHRSLFSGLLEALLYDNGTLLVYLLV